MSRYSRACAKRGGGDGPAEAVGRGRRAVAALFREHRSLHHQRLHSISEYSEGTAVINRDFFFREVNLRLFGGALKPTARTTMNDMLTYWEARGGKSDDRWLAYVFATAHHETD